MGCGASRGHSAPHAVVMTAHTGLGLEVVPAEDDFTAAQSKIVETNIAQRREVSTNTEEETDTNQEAEQQHISRPGRPSDYLQALCEVAKLRIELRDTRAALERAERKIAAVDAADKGGPAQVGAEADKENLLVATSLGWNGTASTAKALPQISENGVERIGSTGSKLDDLIQELNDR